MTKSAMNSTRTTQDRILATSEIRLTLFGGEIDVFFFLTSHFVLFHIHVILLFISSSFTYIAGELQNSLEFDFQLFVFAPIFHFFDLDVGKKFRLPGGHSVIGLTSSSRARNVTTTSRREGFLPSRLLNGMFWVRPSRSAISCHFLTDGDAWRRDDSPQRLLLRLLGQDPFGRRRQVGQAYI